MARKSFRISCVLVLSIILLPLVVDAAVYAPSDLVGVWEVNGLASGPGAPWWIRGPVTFRADGSWSSALVEYPYEPGTGSGTYTFSTDGAVVISWPGITDPYRMHCNMDMGKSVMVCTQLWPDPPSTTQIAIFTKKASSYSLSDLQGIWGVAQTATGWEAPWWECGFVAISGDGSFSGNMQEYGGGTDHVSATLRMSTAGIITLSGSSGDEHWRATMDSGKTVSAGTATWVSGTSGTAELLVFIKRAASYSQADVAGLWAYHSLVSGGPYAPGWYRGTAAIDSRGQAFFSLKDEYGVAETFSASILIAPDGTLSSLAPAGGACYMDAGKTVIACAITQASGAGTVEMPLLVKMNPISTLTVGRSGTGSGTVTSSPAGMDCTGPCSAVFASGSSVTLTGTADPGSYFTGWSSPCSGNGPCTLTLSADTSLTATFNPVGDPFLDVYPGHWAEGYITAIYEAGITSGWGGTKEFKPDYNVARDQMAAFIVRARTGEPGSGYCGSEMPFTDVPASSWACPYIKRLSELGITAGYGGTDRYRPELTVTREQMAAFIIRAIEGEPAACSAAPFPDVPATSWACPYIKRLSDLGITTGYGGSGLYRPELEVTRAQMAAFIQRAFLSE